MFQIDGIDQTKPSAHASENHDVRRTPPLRVEALTRDDVAIIKCFLLETLRRFGCAAPDTAMLTHAQNAATRATLLLGAFPDRKLRGLLEVYDCGEQRMEVALIVARAWHRQGIGSALLQQAIACGGIVGARSYRLIFATDNWPMRRIAQKTSARLDLVFGEMCADIDLLADFEPVAFGTTGAAITRLSSPVNGR